MEHEDQKPEQVPEADQREADSSDDEDFKKLEEDSTQPKKRIMPKKADFRMRAHINPLSDTPFPYPLNPDYVNWKIHYPAFFDGTPEENELVFVNTNEHPITFPEPVPDVLNGRKSPYVVQFVDVGCGFGGLLMALAEHFPNKLSFGLEIRDKLCNYVGEKIKALRIENPGKYGNIAVSRSNAMRHLSNYFRKGQLEKLFFCFADPHFKKSNYRRRIIGTGFLTEYAYLLKQGGRIYSISDVLELHEWNDLHMSQNKQFRKLTNEEMEQDICVKLIRDETEEGKKVARNGGSKYTAVYEKL